MTVAADLHRLSENDRIKLIGQSVMQAPQSSADPPKVTGFVVENDSKADRYIEKLQKRFPGLRVVDRQPLAGTILVRVAGPLR